MIVEQFVMAYEVEQDRLRALLPEGFTSLRPVLRINAEIRRGDSVSLELNTPVEAFGKRGWLNVQNWSDRKDELTYQRSGSTVAFLLPFLTITYTDIGLAGGCPAEKDNDGCYFLNPTLTLRPAEQISANKAYCECEFAWSFTQNDARGVSTGTTLPAFFTEPKVHYEKQQLSAPNAAAIPCEQVLGAYKVIFERAEKAL